MQTNSLTSSQQDVSILLPTELQGHLSTLEQRAGLLLISQIQSSALPIRVLSSPIDKTSMLPNELLKWRPLHEHNKSLGSIKPDVEKISKFIHHSWDGFIFDCAILVQINNYWHVIHPVLLAYESQDDSDDLNKKERLGFNANKDLQPELQQAGGWATLAEVMPKAIWAGNFWRNGAVLMAAIVL